MVWRHASNGTVCHHSLVADSSAPEGYYCVIGGIVRLDDGGPRTDDAVMLADDEPVEPPQALPPRKYLDDSVQRRRHRAKVPILFAPWPEGLAVIGIWVIFAGIIISVLIGVVLYLLS
jgi:hypothetical protein